MCVDSNPGVHLCVLHPIVQNAPFHRGEGKRMLMMCVYVDINLGMFLCLYNPVCRTLHSTGGRVR